jgi:hypothetical protein
MPLADSPTPSPADYPPGHACKYYGATLPVCDACRESPAFADGATIHGPWAYMCETCFSRIGIGFGTGRGQRLILANPNPESR